MIIIFFNQVVLVTYIYELVCIVVFSKADKRILAAVGFLIVRTTFRVFPFYSLLVRVANSVDASFCCTRRLIYN